MAKKETIVEDKVYDTMIQAFKEMNVWHNGSYKHYEETSDEFLEGKICYYKRCYSRACNDNWRFASWREVDKYKILLEYLDSIIQGRVDKLARDFKFVKI